MFKLNIQTIIDHSKYNTNYANHEQIAEIIQNVQHQPISSFLTSPICSSIQF